MTKKKTDNQKPTSPEADNQSENVFREFIKDSKNFKALESDKYHAHEEKPKDQQQEASKSTESSLPYHYKLTNHNHTHNSDNQNLDYQLSEYLWRPEVSSEEYLFYFQHGVQYRTIRKFRAGKIRVEASLDLHQLNKEQARIQFAKFIQDSYADEKRCVCIIHGKGNRSGSNSPILKNLVNHWLHDLDVVLGFCSCPSNMGGTGAVLVLLKRVVE